MYRKLFQKLFSGMYNKYLLITGMSLFGVYACLVVGTIFSISHRKAIRQDIKVTQARVADLEVHYFALADGLTEDTATQLGLLHVDVPQFSYRNPQDAVAILR
jgi:hypothetical protein